jgi:pilus assembly protein CpaB
MDRRFLTVLGVSLVFALVISSIFYQMSARAGGGDSKKAEPDTQDVVVAAKPLPVGVTVKPDDIKLVKLPLVAFPKGGFSKPEEVIDRPVISNVLMDEPVLEGRLAARGSGLGLAPIIPVGMRAVSVRVNEVVGVAGFVLPGMHVDVLVTGRPPGDNTLTMTTTVLQDITVLSAGQTVQPDPRGQAINAPVVTLLVSPDHAEVLTLAGNEAKIQLVLRNGSDTSLSQTSGRRLYELYKIKGGASRSPEDEDADRRRARARAVAMAQAAPPPPVAVAPPPPPVPDQIVVIRGNQKTVEVVGNARVGRN